MSPRLTTICSPPYMRLTEQNANQASYLSEYTGHKAHGYQNDGNIARLDKRAYKVGILAVYKELHIFLEPDEYVALVTRNCISDGDMIFLDRITINAMKDAGFEYIETKKARLPDVSFLKRINHRKFHAKKGLPLIDWEEITFYRKG